MTTEHGTITASQVMASFITASFTEYPLEDPLLVASFTEYPLEDPLLVASFTGNPLKDPVITEGFAEIRVIPSAITERTNCMQGVLSLSLS